MWLSVHQNHVPEYTVQRKSQIHDWLALTQWYPRGMYHTSSDANYALEKERMLCQCCAVARTDSHLECGYNGGSDGGQHRS